VIEYIAVNIDSGKVAQLPWCGDAETSDYDLVSKSIYSIGLIIDSSAPGGAVRTLVQTKSDASGCSVVGNVTGYWIISMGVSAIDTDQRVLYFLSYPCVKEGDPGCQGNGPVDLVGVDLHTAKIVSVASAFCSLEARTVAPSLSGCPWSLEYANPTSRTGAFLS